MSDLLPSLTLATDGEEAIILIGAMFVGMVAIVGGFVTRILSVRAREKTKREIAAYVAEGSMTPEEGERLIRAERPVWEREHHR